VLNAMNLVIVYQTIKGSFSNPFLQDLRMLAAF